MKKLETWKEKKSFLCVKIIVLLCLTTIGGCGIITAPSSDQPEMEEELQKNQQELAQQEEDAAKSVSETAVQNASETAIQKDSAGAAKNTTNTITVIGDSVFLGAAPAFKKIHKNAVIDAKISRQVSHGLDVAKELKKKDKLRSTVIISLGTNGMFNPATGQALIEYLGPERTIYWIDAYGKNLEFQKEVNQNIQDLADKYPNVHRISWAAEAKKHPDWFYQDGTHLNTKGQPKFAEFIHASMEGEGSPSP